MGAPSPPPPPPHPALPLLPSHVLQTGCFAFVYSSVRQPLRGRGGDGMGWFVGGECEERGVVPGPAVPACVAMGGCFTATSAVAIELLPLPLLPLMQQGGGVVHHR